MYELSEKNKLFYLSHVHAEKYPQEASTWFAVGVYHLATERAQEARRYFSKASLMNPHFGPAWIGFAHSFALEGEHDQAISAYTTAARLFEGSHLPYLYMAMQHIELGSVRLAHEFLRLSYRLCKSDPLLLNELGIVLSMQNRHEEAINFFVSAINIIEVSETKLAAWSSIYTNKGHALRKLELVMKLLRSLLI